VRDRIGGVLLASEMVYAGGGYCVALARFGAPADAELLVTYLNRWLSRIDCDYDQDKAIGALLYLDARLATNRAACFLGRDGLWERWAGGKNTDPQEEKWLIEQYRILADGGRPSRPRARWPARWAGLRRSASRGCRWTPSVPPSRCSGCPDR
jgi:hypothetical protein